jgi:hypothetical protein
MSLIFIFAFKGNMFYLIIIRIFILSGLPDEVI